MAVPAIDITQSVPDFRQWQSWGFQPYATNTPTAWTARGLPPGVSINTTSGRISGASTLPGVFQFVLTASNADGPSLPVTFVVGIRPSAQPLTSGSIETQIDLATRAVTFAGVNPTAGLLLKRGDDVLFHVRFMRDTLACDLDLIAFKFALKQIESEEPPVILDATFLKTGTGEDAVYRIPVALTIPDDLFDDPKDEAAVAILDRSALSELLGEFEWRENNPYGVGPSIVRSSSQSFGVLVVRDLIVNA